MLRSKISEQGIQKTSSSNDNNRRGSVQNARKLRYLWFWMPQVDFGRSSWTEKVPNCVHSIHHLDVICLKECLLAFPQPVKFFKDIFPKHLRDYLEFNA